MPESCQINGAGLVTIIRSKPEDTIWCLIHIKQKFNMIPSAKELKKKAKPVSAANGSNGSSRQSNGSSRSKTSAKIHEQESLLDDKELLRILLQVRNGNFTVRMPIGEVGVKGRVFDTLNEIISLNEE